MQDLELQVSWTRQATDGDWMHKQLWTTRKSCYLKDDRAMHPIYECKRKINRRLCKNHHITILSLVRKSFSKCSKQCDQGTYTLQTDGWYTVASPHGKTRETKCCRYYRHRRYL